MALADDDEEEEEEEEGEDEEEGEAAGDQAPTQKPTKQETSATPKANGHTAAPEKKQPLQKKESAVKSKEGKDKASDKTAQPNKKQTADKARTAVEAPPTTPQAPPLAPEVKAALAAAEKQAARFATVHKLDVPTHHGCLVDNSTPWQEVLASITDLKLPFAPTDTVTIMPSEHAVLLVLNYAEALYKQEVENFMKRTWLM